MSDSSVMLRCILQRLVRKEGACIQLLANECDTSVHLISLDAKHISSELLKRDYDFVSITTGDAEERRLSLSRALDRGDYIRIILCPFVTLNLEQFSDRLSKYQRNGGVIVCLGGYHNGLEGIPVNETFESDGQGGYVYISEELNEQFGTVSTEKAFDIQAGNLQILLYLAILNYRQAKRPKTSRHLEYSLDDYLSGRVSDEKFMTMMRESKLLKRVFQTFIDSDLQSYERTIEDIGSGKESLQGIAFSKLDDERISVLMHIIFMEALRFEGQMKRGVRGMNWEDFILPITLCFAILLFA
ncbi:hypothetical protein [Vibrio splendidus]|uniref:hypothetical protein n=1 Tax=Vibrio splendidus TaxID=29497 RepID=UPI003D0CA68D